MKLINAHFLTGELVTIETMGSKITTVMRQNALMSDNHSINLDRIASESGDSRTIDCAGALIVPAGIDVHVHSRDPGHTHKEDWLTLAQGAFKGGVVAVCDMPNTVPATMDRSAIMEKAKLASASGLEFKFYLGVGAGNIEALRGLLDDESLPLCGLKVYYGNSTGELMYDDLERLAAALNPKFRGVLSFHSEDQCTIDCNMAAHKKVEISQGHPESFIVHSEIRSSAAAWKSTETIINWAIRHQRAIHIAHISTPKEVEMILAARQAGLRITTEVAPHHLIFSVDDYERLGPLLKMNPPVRSRVERDALVRYFGQGVIDYFATDHAPHTLAEKQAEYGKCPSGVPGIEYFWPLLLEMAAFTRLGPEKVLAMAAKDSAQDFGFHNIGVIASGYDASFVWIKLEPNDVANAQTVSKCGWTPYHGMKLSHKVGATWHKGIKVYPR
jgi:dihydroorotase